MKEVRIKIFKFAELDKKVQEKIIERFRENTDHDFLEELLNDKITELLKEEDLEIKYGREVKTEILYDLDYSQGSGLCFIGSLRMKVLDKEYIIIITHIGHYYHNKSVEIIIEDAISGDVEDYKSDVYALFRDKYDRICKKLENAGYAEIEYQESDSTITENINANDYWFYKDGTIYHERDSE